MHSPIVRKKYCSISISLFVRSQSDLLMPLRSLLGGGGWQGINRFDTITYISAVCENMLHCFRFVIQMSCSGFAFSKSSALKRATRMQKEIRICAGMVAHETTSIAIALSTTDISPEFFPLAHSLDAQNKRIQLLRLRSRLIATLCHIIPTA